MEKSEFISFCEDVRLKCYDVMQDSSLELAIQQTAANLGRAAGEALAVVHLMDFDSSHGINLHSVPASKNV